MCCLKVGFFNVKGLAESFDVVDGRVDDVFVFVSRIESCEHSVRFGDSGVDGSASGEGLLGGQLPYFVYRYLVGET